MICFTSFESFWSNGFESKGLKQLLSCIFYSFQLILLLDYGFGQMELFGLDFYY